MKNFNIRAYGILLNKNNEVLITDEFRYDKEITKFPGGGLIWGESTIDCIKREFMEELGIEIEIVKHFYTTDFFQESAFNKEHQIISIYYLVKNTTDINIKFSILPFDFEKKEGAQSFRWIPIKKIEEKDFTFPIDKKVGGMLKDYSKSL